MEDLSAVELILPGFRFHPTDEELLTFYLKNMIFQKEPRVNVIGFLNIYRHDPWDLPALAQTNKGERQWYFFVPRDRKNGSRGRPNRTTENGFWKATGSDRKVISLSEPKKIIGQKRTLVFYEGRAPRGCKTDWVMNEFRLPDTIPSPMDIVLCKIYRKATSLKVLEQKAAAEEESSTINPLFPSSPIAPKPTLSSSSSVDNESSYFCNESSYISHHQDLMAVAPQITLKKEDEEQIVEEQEDISLFENQNKTNEETTRTSKPSYSSIQLPYGQENLADLLVPKSNMDWTEDSFWAQLRSPWLDNQAFYANLLNF